MPKRGRPNKKGAPHFIHFLAEIGHLEHFLFFSQKFFFGQFNVPLFCSDAPFLARPLYDLTLTCDKKLEIFTGATSSCSSSSKENVSSSENSELFDEFLDIWCFGGVLFLNRFRNDEKLLLLLLFVELELSKSLDVSVSRLVDDFSPKIARKELKM